MRTVKEIYLYIRDRFNEHDAQKDALAVKVSELKSAINADKQAQHTAAASNDSQAYARAVTDEGFHRAQLEQAQEATLAPAFTPDEFKALRDELIAAERAFCAPIYKRLVELLDEGESLYKMINDMANVKSAIWSACASKKGGYAFPFPSNDNSLEALFAPNSNSRSIRETAQSLNK